MDKGPDDVEYDTVYDAELDDDEAPDEGDGDGLANEGKWDGHRLDKSLGWDGATAQEMRWRAESGEYGPPGPEDGWEDFR